MLQVEHLRKTFGRVVAVDDVSFEIQPGTILGIVGQNGSGKTTIFRMILNFLTPENGGQVKWDGQPLHMKKVYDTVGYLPEERGLYETMTIEKQIMYFARLRGMKKKEINAKIHMIVQNKIMTFHCPSFPSMAFPGIAFAIKDKCVNSLMLTVIVVILFAF